jgi:hypothetical protein
MYGIEHKSEHMFVSTGYLTFLPLRPALYTATVVPPELDYSSR